MSPARPELARPGLAGLEAVVFDADGVLLESTDIKQRAFLDLFAAHPEHHPAIVEHHQQNLGVSRFRKFEWIYRHLLERPLPASESERLNREYSALVLDRTLACPLVPGTRELLGWLEGRLPAFVASGAPQGELETVLEGHGLRRYFAGVWGTPREKHEILATLLAERGWRPEQVLMVGDAISDYRAARRTGVRFVLRRTADQEPYCRDLEVERVDDLLDLRELLAEAVAAAGVASGPAI